MFRDETNTWKKVHCAFCRMYIYIYRCAWPLVHRKGYYVQRIKGEKGVGGGPLEDASSSEAALQEKQRAERKQHKMLSKSSWTVQEIQGPSPSSSTELTAPAAAGRAGKVGKAKSRSMPKLIAQSRPLAPRSSHVTSAPLVCLTPKGPQIWSRSSQGNLHVLSGHIQSSGDCGQEATTEAAAEAEAASWQAQRPDWKKVCKLQTFSLSPYTLQSVLLVCTLFSLVLKDVG